VPIQLQQIQVRPAGDTPQLAAAAANP
jgi:hypothetical protein